MLRWVSFDGVEIVRAIYGAVRDTDWGTLEPRFTRYDVSQDGARFHARFEAVHARDEIDFAWQGEIDVEARRIRFAMDGEARTAFFTNRVGLCVLHPDTMAGAPIRLRTPWGEVRGRIPVEIAAVTPFTNIEALEFAIPGTGEVSVTFSGDLFEMEDQRNWTDASFKTFSTPLSLPAPRFVEAGTEIHQEVVVEITPARRRRSPRARPTAIAVGRPVSGMPAIGTCASPPGSRASADIVARTRTLGLSHVRVFATLPDDLSSPALSEQLAEAQANELPIELEIRATPDGEGVGSVIGLICKRGLALARILVFDRRTFITTSAQLQAAGSAIRSLGLSTPIGGGSCADFAELNQRRPPMDRMDFVAYRVTPQVHASDDASIMENIAGQSATVRSAKALAGGRPIAVGPVTLRGLFNPVASDPARVSPSDFAETVDPRLATLFGAAWTVGTLAALSTAGARAITIHRIAGAGGLQPERADLVSGGESRTPVAYPAIHVLEALASTGRPLRRLHARGGTSSLAVLAVRSGLRTRILVANLTPGLHQVTLRVPSVAVAVSMLDDRAMSDAQKGFRGVRDISRHTAAGDNSLTIELRPYAVAQIDHLDRD
jgi:D-apionolactonase